MTEKEKAILEIDVYGFTILERVLSEDEAIEMREALIRCEREVGEEHTHRGTARHVSNLPTLDRIFHKTIDHPRTLPILEHFLGKSMILGSLNSRIVRPGDGYQGLHGDILQGDAEQGFAGDDEHGLDAGRIYVRDRRHAVRSWEP